MHARWVQTVPLLAHSFKSQGELLPTIAIYILSLCVSTLFPSYETHRDLYLYRKIHKVMVVQLAICERNIPETEFQ